MTKQEFWRKIKENKWDDRSALGGWEIETDVITDADSVIGCAFDGGMWKVFEAPERWGHHIIKEFANEREAFDMLYELIQSMAKTVAEIKGQPFGDDSTWYE